MSIVCLKTNFCIITSQKKSVIKCQYLRCKTKTTAEYIGFVVAIKWIQFYLAVCVVVSITTVCVLYITVQICQTNMKIFIAKNHIKLFDSFIQNQRKFMLFA